MGGGSGEIRPIVKSVLDSATSVATNDRGFQEAVLGGGHVFILVPNGLFPMGSAEGLPIEQPVHSVYLNDYWIGKYPITVGQFRTFVESTGYTTDAEQGWGAWQWTGEIPQPGAESDPWEPREDGAWNNIYFEQGDDHPVGSVSWNDAQAYCAWLSEELQLPIVLPTEAQWEKSARGTGADRFPWGDDYPGGHHANLADSRFISKYGPHTRRPHPEIDDGFVETAPVNAYPEGQSAYGVYDLAGNLGEWVYDIFDRHYYETSPDRNPTGPKREPGVPDEEIDRVNRGGSWVDWAGVTADGLPAPEGGHSIRSAARTGDEQNSSDDHMGFRIAIDGIRSAEPPVRIPE